MDTRTDISNLDDVKKLVDNFYFKVQRDELLGGIFNGAIKDWPQHLSKMYRFWQTVLLEEHTYDGSPFPPHAQLPVGKEHFDRWLALFQETIGEHFSGKISEEAYWRAGKMAEMFQHKIAYFQARNGSKPLV